MKNRLLRLILKLDKIKYNLYSINKRIQGRYKAVQPVVFRGKGTINFGDDVSFGVVNSPYFLNSYAYIEPRSVDAKISFGHNVNINNAFSVSAEHSITIGNNVLIGFNCQISDSNFHDLKPDRRHNTDPEPKAVVIKNNVFIGNNVTVLKGVTIGENTVIGNGSMVTQSFGDNVIVAGVPAKVIGQL